MKLRQRTAQDVGIEPNLVKGYEKHGEVYFTWHDSVSVGAQCGFCHIIVWTDSRADKILNQNKPKNIPNSGEKYKQYYLNKIRCFLDSLPECPNCNAQKYDLFVTNVDYPRFADGTLFPANTTDLELIRLDPSSIKIWWLEE